MLCVLLYYTPESFDGSIFTASGVPFKVQFAPHTEVMQQALPGADCMMSYLYGKLNINFRSTVFFAVASSCSLDCTRSHPHSLTLTSSLNQPIFPSFYPLCFSLHFSLTFFLPTHTLARFPSFLHALSFRFQLTLSSLPLLLFSWVQEVLWSERAQCSRLLGEPCTLFFSRSSSNLQISIQDVSPHFFWNIKPFATCQVPPQSMYIHYAMSCVSALICRFVCKYS